MNTKNDILKVLICDDDLQDRKVIHRYLDSITDREIVVVEAEETNQIQTALKKGRIDLVFLDLQMPGKSGMEWLDEITEKQLAPVVILTGFGSEEIAVESLEKGAIGYLSKANLSLEKVGSAINDALYKWEKHLLLRGDLDELDRIISHDPLTGLLNRRTLDKKIEEEINRARRYEEGFVTIMIDIDHFKRINDRYGHLVGDEVLEKIGALLQGKLRETDFAGRYGGEEFLIIIPKADLSTGLTVASRIRKSIMIMKMKNKMQSFKLYHGEAFNVTVSQGITTYSSGDDRRSIIERADKALFIAKSAGRNCIRVDDLIEYLSNN